MDPTTLNIQSLRRLRPHRGGLPVARRQTRRCVRALRGRYQGRGIAPALLERRQSGERAHPHGRLGFGQRPRWGHSPRQAVGVDHVWQIAELRDCETRSQRLAAITLSHVPELTKQRGFASYSGEPWKVQASADRGTIQPPGNTVANIGSSYKAGDLGAGLGENRQMEHGAERQSLPQHIAPKLSRNRVYNSNCAASIQFTARTSVVSNQNAWGSGTA